MVTYTADSPPPPPAVADFELAGVTILRRSRKKKNVEKLQFPLLIHIL